VSDPRISARRGGAGDGGEDGAGGGDDGKAGDEWPTSPEEATLALVAVGHTNAEIGERLFVSPSTVKSHLSSLQSQARRPQPGGAGGVGVAQRPHGRPPLTDSQPGATVGDAMVEVGRHPYFERGPRLPALDRLRRHGRCRHGCGRGHRTAPPRPRPSEWAAAGLVVIGLLLPTVLVFAQCRSGVKVDEQGLYIRSRLVVPAHQLGEIRVLHSADALYAHRDLKHAFTFPWRQNLYGGIFGWGKGVLVEHRIADSRSRAWVLPGRHRHELVAALERAREGGRSGPVRQPLR
jgi:hypothetical protein